MFNFLYLSDYRPTQLVHVGFYSFAHGSGGRIKSQGSLSYQVLCASVKSEEEKIGQQTHLDGFSL